MASYLYSENVHLDGYAVGFEAPDERDETGTFLRELAGRHALACAARLKDFMPAIERRSSSTTALVRQESKGVIYGRLDAPRYIAVRSQRRPPPREYPIIVTRESPETPENALVTRALAGLATQLRVTPFPIDTAEGRASAALHAWVRSRLRREPWADVRRRDTIDRLRSEASRRIRKHQTGNDVAYHQLLQWTQEWQADIGSLGSAGAEMLVDGILAFPTGEFFWNKIFEIWTLKQVADSLLRVGCIAIGGPQPLHRRDRGPIYRFRCGAAEVNLWFQRQAPLGEPRWTYQEAHQPLTGIPDLVVSMNTHSLLLIDAKYREVTRSTRPEETYKMLGYAENFRNRVTASGFQGMLIFVGDRDSITTLTEPGGGKLRLVVVNQTRTAGGSSAQLFDAVLQEWIIRK